MSEESGNGKEQKYAREYIKDQVKERAQAAKDEKSIEKVADAVIESVKMQDMHDEAHHELKKELQGMRQELHQVPKQDDYKHSWVKEFFHHKTLGYILFGVILALLAQGKLPLELLANIL